jgi:hypothetical protein
MTYHQVLPFFTIKSSREEIQLDGAEKDIPGQHPLHRLGNPHRRVLEMPRGLV